MEFYEESVERFNRMFRFNPHLAVCDLHPDYLSSQFAESLEIEILKVQHHHAHIASTMASNQYEESVIGIAMDGTGLGTDGHIWGGEFFISNLKSFERICHFDYVPIQGGDVATKMPWKAAASYLHHYFGDSFNQFDLPFLSKAPKQNLDFTIQALNKNINTPLSSSAGRLFDAVAALTNICTKAGFHAEAPMRLEGAISPNHSVRYDIENSNLMNWKSVFQQIISDIENGTESSIISTKFHNTFVEVLLQKTKDISSQSGLKTIALSGGTFQNKYILKNLVSKLQGNGYQVLLPQGIPANDGGLALGQMVIAAAHRK